MKLRAAKISHREVWKILYYGPCLRHILKPEARASLSIRQQQAALQSLKTLNEHHCWCFLLIFFFFFLMLAHFFLPTTLKYIEKQVG